MYATTVSTGRSSGISNLMQLDLVELAQKYSCHLENTCGCRVTLLTHSLSPSLSITFVQGSLHPFLPSLLSTLLSIDWLRPILPLLTVRLPWPADTHLMKQYCQSPCDSRVTRICRVLLTLHLFYSLPLSAHIVPHKQTNTGSITCTQLTKCIFFFSPSSLSFYISREYFILLSSSHLILSCRGQCKHTIALEPIFVIWHRSVSPFGRWCFLIFTSLSPHLV